MTVSWTSPWRHFLLSPRSAIDFVFILLRLLLLHLFAAGSLPVYIIAKIFHTMTENYGKFLGYTDSWFDEEYSAQTPQNSTVTTLIINGDLSLDNFVSTFTTNVLNAPCKLNPNKIRYPELRQYLTTFMGFRTWKNDVNFLIGNHITERFSDFQDQCSQKWFEDLSSTHQNLLNIPYPKGRSPWEIILVRNVKFHDQLPNERQQTMLACRVHHVMADGKSLLKLFVECLGGKELTSVQVKSNKDTLIRRIIHVVCFGYNVIIQYIYLVRAIPKMYFHPFKVSSSSKAQVKTVLAFTSNLSLSDMKRIAKRNNVVGSAVFMSIIAGAIRKCGKKLEESNVTIPYTLPKHNHPEKMSNHFYAGITELPTKEANIIQRLKACHANYEIVRRTRQAEYLDFLVFIGGSLLFPFSRLAKNSFAPTGITNIAGEQVGFSVGTSEVVDFRMSSGTLRGVAGVAFVIVSYKNGVRVAVISKENCLDKQQAENLALNIEEEFKLLNGI